VAQAEFNPQYNKKKHDGDVTTLCTSVKDNVYVFVNYRKHVTLMTNVRC
jgi:hypothetical protein